MDKKKISVSNNDDDNKKSLKRNGKNSKQIKLVVAITLVLTISVGIIGIMTTSTNNNNNNNNSSSQNITGSWMDVHGMGIYSSEKGDNDDQLYLATHNGLFKKEVGNNSSNTTGRWAEVGNDKSDLMGFTINPNKEGFMYSSGHPKTGGNLGFRISDDYGVTWQKVSDVTTPTPVDFHTMTVGNNPEIIYAASGIGDNIFISTDEGKNWSIVNPPNREKVITLTANQTDSDIVYASTTNGLFSSIDRGRNWQNINNELINGDNHDTIVTGLEISSDGKIAYAFVTPGRGEDVNGYIIKSIDGGNTWTKTGGQIDGAMFVSKFAFGNNGEIYLIVNQDSMETDVASSVFSSKDDGKTWILEGTNNKSLAGS